MDNAVQETWTRRRRWMSSPKAGLPTVQTVRETRSRKRLFHVRVDEIPTLEEQRLSCNLCERVGEAVAEIQFRRVSTASAEITVVVTRDPRLRLGDRVNGNLCFLQQIVNAAAGNGIAAAIDDPCSLHETDRRHPSATRPLDR